MNFATRYMEDLIDNSGIDKNDVKIKRLVRNNYFIELIVPLVAFYLLALFGDFIMAPSGNRFESYRAVYILGAIPHVLFSLFNLNAFFLSREHVYSSRFITMLNRLLPMMIPGIQFWGILALMGGAQIDRLAFVLLAQPFIYFVTVQVNVYRLRQFTQGLLK